MADSDWPENLCKHFEILLPLSANCELRVAKMPFASARRFATYSRLGRHCFGAASCLPIQFQCIIPSNVRGYPMAEKVKSRGLTRRLVHMALSLATLSGGGWGVYHYTHSTDPRAVDTETTQSSATVDELKHLFASESTATAKTALVTKPSPIIKTTSPLKQPSRDDRYGLNAKSPLPKSPPENPFSFAPPAAETKIKTESVPQTESTDPALVANGYGDRYVPKVKSTVTAPAPTAKSLPAKPQLEVTRGQDGQNPLRSPAGSLAAVSSEFAQSDDQARAAFRDAQPLQPTVTANNRYVARQSDSESLDINSSAPLRDPAFGIQSQDMDLSRPMASENRLQEMTPQRSLLTNPPSQKTARVAPRNLLPSDDALGARPLPRSNDLISNAANNNLPGNFTPTPGLTSTIGTGRPGERLLEGAQSPSVTIQKLSPREIQVGKKCTFAIRVQNTGQRTAQNVQIRDEVPMGTELLGTVPRASVSGSEIIWDLGTLSVGEERTVEVELIPTDEGELGSVATVLFSAQASAKARCTRPGLALRLSCSKPQVLVGKQQVVQVEVSNPGSGDATGVMLLESVPTGVSHAAGPALELEIGTLRAGESRRLELVLNAEQAGQIDNVMTARADANLQVDASCQFEVIAPRLQVSVEGPKRRYLERPATYQVSVENPGTASAKEVQLVTHLSKGLKFVKANNMGEYDTATHSVHWSLAELPANERGTVELVALPVEAGEQTLQIATKAGRGLEDRVEKRVMVEGLVAIMFEVVDVEDPIEIGGETTYEVRVLNQGSKLATNLQLIATMTPGIQAISAQGETQYTIQGERVLFKPLPQLGPKADTTYRIHVQGIRAGDQRVRVQITTDDLQQPITKEESTRVYSDQ